ncbi:MAG TPA: response regulator [Steroidobacteraceae bacterium]|nr:response regulator [Steroidobacteraceae bacterium]
MGAKRALIVDDSKSARLFLARVLEKYDIDVDAAESAEAAIDYLNSNRPDVIFMDHLMPGMDGLQAVQHIKNDPRTATIPIMMYTSQEGELYLGQARALGAIGVLPKQIKPADVSKVLYQLHLLPDRRTGEQSSFTALNVRVEPEGLEATTGVLSKPLTDSTLREHFAELRRALVAGVDTQTERITSEVRALLLEALPQPSPPVAGPELPPPEPPRPAPPWAWIVAGTALAIALLSTALWWRSVHLLEDLRAQVGELREQRTPALLTPATGPVAVAPAPTPGGALIETKPIEVLVPYGADPLGESRLEVIGKLLYQLAAQKQPASVDIRTYAGRFCLVGNPTDGYSVAPDEMLYSRCNVVGNPTEDAQPPAQRTPLALANLIGEVRSSSGGVVDTRVGVGDPASLAQPYPTVAPDLTAGEWNRAAIANNRVEIRVH